MAKPQPQPAPVNSPENSTELSSTDRLEFAVAAERFRNAQLQVQNAQLALEVATMRWDVEKTRIKTMYVLRDNDQIDPNTGKILRP
jgi:hypothetical protein